MSTSQEITTGNIIVNDGTVNLVQNANQNVPLEVRDVSMALAELRKMALASTDLDEIDKGAVKAAIDEADKQLKAPEPDLSKVDKAVSWLKQILSGVETLAPATIRVAELIAKHWAV
ncbi:hypothetical protein SAMN05192549_115158 [Duganella sacchari]|uniref:Uncharacterized protein n=1 Tax=Duganella sacchari TaxID=551987 RepID=A0A1M7R9V3_9BURK|nr:hypothetical protein [Duganella sacchari]SHN43026.1 hypothetical protein SAMN05192549_115158 [Duganella sacchari]